VLLVDEAHGPHLGFNSALPPSALQCGADACAQSTHKITGAMTQCSMLQVKQEHLDLQRAKDTMSLLTTTSPNYLLMASLDAARAQLEEHGSRWRSMLCKRRKFCGRRFSRFPDCNCWMNRLLAKQELLLLTLRR
jgi:arginine/lysine/ornithine decarboxylase